jgi:subtilisin-like proprotein convertase family protein
VQEILMKSARQIDASDSDWTTNSGGMRFNHKFGAGLADASAAVALAATWTNLAPQTSLTLAQSGISLSIPDTATSPVIRTFDPGTSLRVEHVVLQTTISHARRGDLRIELVSPSGMVSMLADEREDANAHYNSWSFSSVRHWGESSRGIWKVRISDRRSGVIGSIDALTLNIYGTPAAAPTGAPVVTSATTASTTVGAPFRYQITARNNPTSFAATGLPAGLSLNASTGLISGSTTTAGTGNISLTATNGSGTSSATTLSLTRTALLATSLENAVDAPFAKFTTRGSVVAGGGWTRVITPTQDGTDAAASGTTGNSQ